MMEDFYCQQNNNVEMSERQRDVLIEILEGMRGESIR